MPFSGHFLGPREGDSMHPRSVAEIWETWEGGRGGEGDSCPLVQQGKLHKETKGLPFTPFMC